MDDFLDQVVRRDQIGGNALHVGEAERFLFMNEAGKAGLEVAYGRAQRRDHVSFGFRKRRLNAVERAHRHVPAVFEVLDLGIGGVRDKLDGCRAHHQEAGLEVAAGVRHHGVAVHAVEVFADFAVAGEEGEAVGEKADDRNDVQHDYAGADRQPRENSREVHSGPEIGREARSISPRRATVLSRVRTT